MIGVYIHIPFCLKKCRYCDFFSVGNDGWNYDLVENYIDCLKMETKRKKEMFPTNVDTIFIGGGTPSILPVEMIKEIIAAVGDNFFVSHDAEISIEINPAPVDKKKLTGFKEAGINRASLGTQSFNNNNLRYLGRVHDSSSAIKTFALIKETGFKSTGIDLMWGLPDQMADLWINDLIQAVELQPDHLSLYELTPEEGTPAGDDIRCGKVQKPDEEELISMMAATDKLMSCEGFGKYEISNWAKPNKECLHNLKYWNYEKYLGVGASAASFNGTCRFTNIPDVSEYIARIRDKSDPEDFFEELPVKSRMGEFMMMGLRKTKGVKKSDFAEKFKKNIFEEFGETIKSLEKCGWLKVEIAGGNNDAFIRIPPEYLSLQSEIAEKFIYLEDEGNHTDFAN